MGSLREGFRFAHGLAGLLGGGVIAFVGAVVGVGVSFGVGGGGVWTGVFLFGILIALVSPLWYWLVRPFYIWRFGERDAPWYRPPGTLHPFRIVRYTAIGGYSIILIVIALIIVAIAFGGGPTTLNLGEAGSTETLTAVATEYETASELVEWNAITEEYEERKTPPAGATFVLIRFEVTNTGETRAKIPGGEIIGAEIVLRYKDSTADPVNVDNFMVDEQRYRSYSEQVESFDDTLFPDQTISGWLVFELPQGFEQDDAVLRVEIEDEVLEWRLG